MGRKKGGTNKDKEIKLSEGSLKRLQIGLQQAKEGKLIPQEELEKEGLLPEISKEQKERREKLKGVMRDINKNIEGAKVDYANTIGVRERQSFGYKCLDMLTGGGIERGNCSVI
jgi:hypothetical protein